MLKTYLILDDEGTVINSTVFNPDLPEEEGWIERESEDIGIGWKRGNDGKFAAPEPEPEIIPIVVSMLKFRIAVTKRGLRNQFEKKIKLAELDIQDQWQLSMDIDRQSDVVKYIQSSLGISDAIMDEIFVEAK